MSPTNIFIFSRDIRSGKTTELTRWLQGKRASGILSPDVNGLRALVDLSDGSQYNFEVTEATSATVAVGKFLFREEAFEKGRQILRYALHDNSEWLIIDEVGKLEVERKEGLEPAVSEVINYYKLHPERKLLLVIRGGLLTKAQAHYALEGAQVIQNLSAL